MAKGFLRNSGTILAAMAFLVVLAGAAILLSPGTVTTEVCSFSAKGDDCQTLTVWDEGGQGGLILFWSVSMTAIAAVPLAFRSKLVRLVVGLSLLTFSFLASTSIGLAFAPGALVMLIASALPPRRRGVEVSG